MNARIGVRSFLDVVSRQKNLPGFPGYRQSSDLDDQDDDRGIPFRKSAAFLLCNLPEGAYN